MTSKLRPTLTRRAWLTTASGLFAAPSLLAQSGAEDQASLAPGAARRIVKRFDFSRGTGGVLAAFTDYDLYTWDLRFLAEIRDLPREVNVPSRNRRAYFLSSNNRPDDIFMYLKAPITEADGLEPGATYKLSLQIELATNSTNCIGAGGSEANLFLKAGGSALEPVPYLMGTYVSINVDKGSQEEGGKDLGVIGKVWNGQECELDPRDKKWVMIRRNYDHPTPITTVHEQLWIAVGTDSGYESVTGLYYYSIEARLTRVG